VITKLEILDTAVKVGLGAAISVLGSYFVAKLTHDRTLQKERAERRRSLLESVAEEVSTFGTVALKHWAFVVNWIQYTDASEKMSAEKYDELVMIRNRLLDCAKELESAGAKLKLLGETEADGRLHAYASSLVVFREDVVTGRDLTVEELESYHQRLAAKHKAFFAELSNAYKKY
jgi:hypothetical protein